MLNRRETLNPKILWITVLLLMIIPLFRAADWHQTFILFSMIYVVGISVPLWFAVDETPVSLFRYMSLAAFFALLGPVLSSVLGSVFFAVPLYIEFPVELSLALFSLSTFLWFVVLLVRRIPFPLMVIACTLLMVGPYLNHGDSEHLEGVTQSASTPVPRQPAANDK